MPAATAENRNVTELFTDMPEYMDVDGNTVAAEFPYDEYLKSRPSPEELRRFRTPVLFWEIKYPGCQLQPYPMMGAFSSSTDGLWTCHYDYQVKAVAKHIELTTGMDAEDLRLSAEDTQIIQGKKPGAVRFCADCGLVTCSLVAVELHEELTGHTTKSEPRKQTPRRRKEKEATHAPA